MSRLHFTEEEIASLFGHEAAEDEDPARLRQYYFKSSTYDQVITNLPLRILVGHKGIGKSALFRVAVAELDEKSKLTIQVKPDDVADIAVGERDFLKTIRLWKEGLREIIARRAARRLGLTPLDAAQAVRSSELVIPALQRAAKESGTPSSPADFRVREDFLVSGKVSIFIDDLDRGWEGQSTDVRRVSALLNATRDLINAERGLQFRISLRSDVYFLVRTSDESTDKLDGSVIWQAWTNHDVFALLVKRIETYFGRDIDIDKLRATPQRDLARSLTPIMEDTFRGKGHWRDAPMHRVLM